MTARVRACVNEPCTMPRMLKSRYPLSDHLCSNPGGGGVFYLVTVDMSLSFLESQLPYMEKKGNKGARAPGLMSPLSLNPTSALLLAK